MEILFAILAAVFLVAASIWWTLRRAGEILEAWAAESRVRVVSREIRWLLRGPFSWRSGEGHVVFRVGVVDERGERRDGFVRCGSWFFGLLSNRADVVWD